MESYEDGCLLSYPDQAYCSKFSSDDTFLYCISGHLLDVVY
jgi:hypothetical protein